MALENLSASDVERALEWRCRFSPDPRATGGVAEVVRSGRSQLHRELPEDFLAEYACESGEDSELERRGLRSALLVPMLLHGRVLGVITFVRAASRRRYAKEDLALRGGHPGRAPRGTPGVKSGPWPDPSPERARWRSAAR